jgi:hypothetical protein
MKGITTNIVKFSKDRYFLINFLNVVFKKQTKSDIILANKITELVETLVDKAPKDYKPELSETGQNETRFIIPDNKEFDNTVYYYLSDTKQRLIENFVYRKFFSIFEIHMSLFSEVEYKLAIQSFMEIYDTPADKYEMLKKRDYRDRISISQNKSKEISGKINSSLSFSNP